jgi:RNA polymerase sigma-70 factor (ECF subfamily)
MTEWESATALAAAVRGDASAFAQLVREHQTMVFSVALHFLRDSARAEDLAQETFLHLHRNLEKIESPEHLVFWLRKVVTHRCIDESRRRLRRRGDVALDAIPEPSTRRHERDPFLSAALRKMVAALPEAQRAIVVLRYQEDMDPGEIAETLDIPLNTVKSRLQRGLEFLRRKMERMA